MANILVVDDDTLFFTQMSLYLQRLGHKCAGAASFEEGVEAARQGDFDIVFLDVYLPDAVGLENIDSFIRVASLPEVIIITGKSDPDSAEMAIRKGAWYYLEKPPAFNTIKLTLERALAFRRKKYEHQTHLLLERDAIVGNSPVLRSALADLARASRGVGGVLITGETGTGKELFARALHRNSSRAEHPFVVVDCTNIPETLAESILFGHMKGAFTDATREREGLFSLAQGGTLLLDEVGDLSESVQRSLLRVLQEKRFRPLGSSREIKGDFRVVAVTNKDITAMVDQGTFRRDLYYRLAQFHLHLPPLRERTGDLDRLAPHYVVSLCAQMGMDVKGVSGEFMDCLRDHDWPGNVRELVNTLETAIAQAMGEPVLYAHHLPVKLRALYIKGGLTRSVRSAPPEPPQAKAPEPGAALLDREEFPSLKDFREQCLDELEARYLDKLLTASGRDVKTALSLAGISRARLYQLLKKHGLRLRG